MSERDTEIPSDESSDAAGWDISLQSHHVLPADRPGTPDATDPSDGTGDEGAPLVAEVLLQHESIFLTPTLASQSVDSIRIDSHVGALLEAQVRFFSVVGDGEVDAALDADGTVRDVTALGTFGNGRVLRGVPTVEAVPLVPAMAELGVRVVEMCGREAGWRLRLQLRNRETFRRLHDVCTDFDVSFSLLTLRRAADAAAGGAGTSLTTAQREALVTALEMGYFDLPRRATQQDVAAALGVSASAVSQRIRRAVGELIDSTLVENVQD
ncbi:MAG: helix-turn-helix domain-containing protein [Haloarculaceae archaeon]